MVARITQPLSKLATSRWLSEDIAESSLGVMLGLGEVRGDEMLDMLDWLHRRQPWIERSLARRPLSQATLVLYDVTSSYVERRYCPLACFGDNCDGKRQIVIGLPCTAEGFPIDCV